MSNLAHDSLVSRGNQSSLDNEHQSLTIWIGTYPVAGQGEATGQGEGVWQAHLDVMTGRLFDVAQASITAAPSFLALGHTANMLYAVNEEIDGGLTVFEKHGRTLETVARAATSGVHPCHLFLHEATRTVLVANYTTGSFVVIQLNSRGLPVADEPQQVFQFFGGGPNAERQEHSHAHYIYETPDGASILVNDLGADCVRRFVPDEGRRTFREAGVAVHLPPGTGPRHAAFSRDGRLLYVVGELDGKVHTVEWDSAAAVGTVVASTTVQPERRDPAGLAHVVLSDGRLVIGARNYNQIVEHELDAAGKPHFGHHVALPGKYPRHHSIVAGWLIVAQQGGGGVVTIDRRGIARGRADIPSPACILLGESA